jgi:hypothetical protein
MRMDVFKKNRVILLYLLMLFFHLFHIFEEIYGRFWLIDAFFGVKWFLIANFVLFSIPIVLFYFVILEKRWAYNLSIIYASIMIVNGVGHNIATIATGRYFNGFAGGYTGIGLFFIGSVMIYFLWKGKPAK